MNPLFIFTEEMGKSHTNILPLAKNFHFNEIFLIYPENDQSGMETMLEAMLQELPDTKITTKAHSIAERSSFHDCIKHIQFIFNDLLNGNHEPCPRPFFLIDPKLPYIRSACLHLLASKNINGVLLNETPSRSQIKGYELNEIEMSDNDLTNQISHIAFEPKPKFIDDAIKEIGLTGSHPKFKRAIEMAAAVAPHCAPVLIEGETGTGKEGFAKLIHALSKQSGREMITVNCASLPETLAESILFGHVKGSFTGAYTSQEGKFEQAHNSTLFLDEVGELSPQIQAKLLRVLESGDIDTIGARKPKQVKVRIIAATNRNLRDEIENGNFRADLFFRLRVGEINLPSLNERRSDIPELASFLLNNINERLAEPKLFAKEVVDLLSVMAWPGNIRDLKNAIERAAIFTKSNEITPDDFLQGRSDNIKTVQEGAPIYEPHEGFSLEQYLTKTRKLLITKALEKSHGNQSKASRLLDITPQAIHKFLKHEKTKNIEIN